MISQSSIPRILTGLVLLLIICNAAVFIFSGLLSIPVKAATTAPNITITFDSCNGEPAIQIQTRPGSTFTQPAKPIRTGYTFKGWYTEPDGAGRLFEQPALNDMTVFANWEIKKYIVCFSPNMQDLLWQRQYQNLPESWSVWVTHGSPIPMPPVYNLNGYDLVNWNTEPDGSGKSIDANIIVTDGLWLFAQWQAKYYSVNLSDWDGSLFGQTSVRYGELLKYPDEPVRPGYRFIDWDGINIIYENCSLTARYEVIPLTLKSDSSFVKDYAFSLIRNIPYGTTQKQLIASFENEISMLKVTHFDYSLITNPNDVLHTGNRIILFTDGQIIADYCLKITDDPAIERPVDCEAGYTPDSNNPGSPITETPDDNPGQTSSATVNEDIDHASTTLQSENSNQTPTHETTSNSILDESQSVMQADSKTYPPAGSTNPTIWMMIGGCTVGSASLFIILTAIQKHLPKPPPIQKS